MATLEINVPDELAERLAQLAESRHSTINEEANRLLDAAPKPTRRSQREVLDEIDRIRESIVFPPGTPDSLELLREDRAR